MKRTIMILWQNPVSVSFVLYTHLQNQCRIFFCTSTFSARTLQRSGCLHFIQPTPIMAPLQVAQNFWDTLFKNYIIDLLTWFIAQNWLNRSYRSTASFPSTTTPEESLACQKSVQHFCQLRVHQSQTNATLQMATFACSRLPLSGGASYVALHIYIAAPPAEFAASSHSFTSLLQTQITA